MISMAAERLCGSTPMMTDIESTEEVSVQE